MLMITSRITSCAAIGVLLGLSGCHIPQGGNQPTIEFTLVPEANVGGPARIEKIEGRAIGAKAGQRIVLFARSGTWWVQPFASKPFTVIQPDSTWKGSTHLGMQYAALLVGPAFAPFRTTDVLPGKGGAVIAAAIVPGRKPATTTRLVPKTIHFSGYEWDVLQIPTDSAGVLHANLASNAWTDAQGWLHLRIAREAGEWSCAEISLQRSLGYGWYSFVVRDLPHLEPGTVLGMFTWDDQDAKQNYREIDIELSQWGESSIKNAQFAVQPDYVPANVFRFDAPSTSLTHSFHWEPGKVSFKTAREMPGSPAHSVAAHVFTSGIPSPGDEAVHINLFTYGKSRIPQKNGVEVVIEKFEYLP